MSFLKKIFFKCLMIFMITHSCPFGCDQSAEITQEICDGRIRAKIVTDYECVLDTIHGEKRKDPTQTFLLLSDWDCAVVGISDFDHANFHRQENTAFVMKTIKDMGIPTAIVTARWTRGSFEKFEHYAQSMESGTGICVSDQKAFTGLKLDLRQGSLQRGICIGGICFTGSSKGPVTSVLIDHPSIPKASHYLYIDDDPKYIEQMIEVFKSRSEKLTIHYYPNEVERQKHESVLSHLSSLKPLRRLPFLMRHNYEIEVRQLLSDTTFVEQIKRTNLFPLLVDLLYSDTEQLIDHVVNLINFNITHLSYEEIWGLLQHAYHHTKIQSAKWLIRNSSREALFPVSLTMIFENVAHIIIKEFFDCTPHKDLLIVDIFSLPKSRTIDPFEILLEAEVVHKDVLPQLEDCSKHLFDNKTLAERLAAAKKKLT